MQLLTYESFGPHVNSTFTLTLGESNIELALTEATRLVAHAFPGMMREPFSLIFRSTSQVVLPQRTYVFSHAAMGKLDIFLVPVGRDARGVFYQAIYN